MKTFEHEVLTFDASDKKGFETMKSTLSTWGDAGFEIVSVVGSSVNASIIQEVLLKLSSKSIHILLASSFFLQ